MVSYAALESEEVWVDEYVAPAQQAFNSRMQSYFRLASAAIGSKGDNNHLYGRHRSYAWAVESIYCTDPSYGTVDGRDQPGDHNWLRATDIGISGKVHWDAARRLDSAVRAGRLPSVAEWFGTFDCFAGEAGDEDLASLLVRTVREALNELHHVNPKGAVVNGVEFTSCPRLDDDSFEPAMPRYPLSTIVWLHA